MTLEQLRQQLHQLATPEAKAASQKFVPGVQKVYGIRMPLLNRLAAELKKDVTADFIDALWKNGSFEERVLAAKLISNIAKKDPDVAIRMVQKYSEEIQDWVVCDTLGMQSLKPVAVTNQKEIFLLAKQLNKSENLWQRRLSLVVVEVYTKDPRMHALIYPLIRNLESDGAYYVKKAVAWLKRNMKK
jgi:3-methyladenine DNA glycosylase AlkD